MGDLISRNALLDAMPKNDELLSVDVRRIICESPKVDAEPVRYGMWEDDNYIWKCNLCHKCLMIEQGDADMNYCPNCGAKMDAEVNGHGQEE